MLDKTYEAAAIEPRVYAAWEKAGAFKAGAGARPGARPYAIVIPPPNVTGSLHMGHALNNTLQDILIRHRRMLGDDVLWQPGTDHAGIATQMVVERQMMENQEPNRRVIGREKFVEKIWAWKAESGGLIVNQLKRLGCSCDWSRERFTLDEGLSRAVAKVFVELYRAGLIYKDKRLVNWDPKFETAISDLEVQQVEVKGSLWHLRYPIEGRAFDPNDPSTFIVVATTRPETMLGDTGVAVNPDDPRYAAFVRAYRAGRPVHAVLPLVGRRIPIVADDYADPEAGSGAVKVTPAHDFNDFEVGKRHGLPMVNIFDREAHVTLKDNPDFLRGLPDGPTLAETVASLERRPRELARKWVVGALEARELIDKIEPHVHTVPHGDRSGVPIEPYLTDQWYVNAKVLAQPAIAAVRDGRTVFVPKNWEKTYFDWMENIQPWCISRQLWWGHQIPAWYGPKKVNYIDGSGWALDLTEQQVFVAGDQAAALADAKAYYRDQRLKVVENWRLVEDAWKTQQPFPAIPIVRDEDVLDTWFSSALWPFSTLGWPERTPELARYYPTSVLVTGFDIIFFWVARMMMMGLHFLKEEPFREVYIHGIVRDEKGAKMSKSKGNVVDPLELIDEYGADALRFTMAALATPGRDVKPARARIEGHRNFATKLWNAARFAEHYQCVSVLGFDPANAEDTLNRWIATEAKRATDAVNAALAAYRFNDAAAAVYRFVWNLTCDWYLELTKAVLGGPDTPAKAETQATVAWVLDTILALLHPFMPFVTEELWGQRSHKTLLALSRWPAPSFEDEAAAAEINWLIEAITAIRSVRSEMNVPAGAIVPMTVSGAGPVTLARLKTHDVAIRRLARVDGLDLHEAAAKGSVQIVLGEATLSLPLAGIIDLDAERTRLSREVDRLSKDIAKIEAKLANADFVVKAPEEVVEEQRERLAEATGRRDRTAALLRRLAA
jgi:valyl-tRNA synthetase